MLLLYLTIVAVGVFGPAPAGQLAQAGKGVRWVDAEVRSAVSGRDAGARSTPMRSRDLVRGLDVEDVGNILMFMPFGALFPASWPRWRRWTIPAGVALSAGIELAQLSFLSWRSPSLIDIRWNSLGTALGFSLWLAIRALRRRRLAAP